MNRKAAKKAVKKSAAKGGGTRGEAPDDHGASHHQIAREARASALAQDYVEVIDDLIRERGEARVVDIARRLAVSHVTVTRTIDRLQRDNLVQAEKYRAIFLTDEGRRLASEVRRRHQIVIQFLRAIGVPLNVACRDAEGIEHHVSKETLRVFERFLSRKKV